MATGLTTYPNPRTVRAILDALPEAPVWQQEARQLQVLQRTLSEVLPAGLAGACQVLRDADESLVLACTSGAVAARLRQIAPRIAHHFSAAGHKVMSIRVEVQAYDATRPAPARPKTPHAVPEGAADAVAALADGMAAGGLADALQHLARRLRDRS